MAQIDDLDIQINFSSNLGKPFKSKRWIIMPHLRKVCVDAQHCVDWYIYNLV